MFGDECLSLRVASELRCGSRWRGGRASERGMEGGKAIDDVGSKAKLKGKGEREAERAREGGMGRDESGLARSVAGDSTATDR